MINIFDDAEQLLQYYAVQSEDFRMRHTAIWTEVQHYTWVLSLVLGAGPAISLTQQIKSIHSLWLLAMLPVLGFIISLLAYWIIKRDFLYYTSADSRLLYLEKMLGITEQKDFLDDRLSHAVQQDFTVAKYIAEKNIGTLRSLFSGKIRGLILSTFIFYGLASLLEFVYYMDLVKAFKPTP